MVDKNSLKLEYLKRVDCFQGLEQAGLMDVLRDSYETRFQKNGMIFFQEDPADKFYLVLEGRVKLTQLNPEGNQVILFYPGPGDVFGVIAVLREINFPVNAQAVEDSTLMAWEARSMKNLMMKHPLIAMNAIRILSAYVMQFQDQILELSTQRVERRIAHALQRLINHAGKKVKEGIAIDLKLTRQDIAEMTGTTLFTVSRTLKKWDTAGIIKTIEEEIIVIEPHQLVNISEDLPIA